MTETFEKLLRDQLDQIMDITHADPELPYSEMADHVRAWGRGERYVPTGKYVLLADGLDELGNLLQGRG